MANQTDVMVLEDGPRNLKVRVTGMLDGVTGNISLIPAVTLASSNNNDPLSGKMVGYRVDHLQYAVGATLSVVIAWQSTNPQLIGVVADSNDQTYRESGGLQPNQGLPGYTGGINVSTQGYAPGVVSGFTLMMDLVKLYKF